MEKTDLTNFVNLWQFYRRKFNAQPLDNVLILDVFDDLKEFSLEEIHTALKLYSRKGRFAPVVADVFDILEKTQGQSFELKALAWLSRLDSKLDRAYDYVSTDWRAVQAFKTVYGNLNAYCDWPEFYENQARKAFMEEYKVAIQHNNTEKDHLIIGMYHNKRPTVRMLETLEECKPILRQIFDPRQVTLSYQAFDPTKPKALPNPKTQQVHCTVEEKQANISQLETLLKQMSSAMKPNYEKKLKGIA